MWDGWHGMRKCGPRKVALSDGESLERRQVASSIYLATSRLIQSTGATTYSVSISMTGIPLSRWLTWSLPDLWFWGPGCSFLIFRSASHVCLSRLWLARSRCHSGGDTGGSRINDKGGQCTLTDFRIGRLQKFTCLYMAEHSPDMGDRMDGGNDYSEYYWTDYFLKISLDSMNKPKKNSLEATNPVKAIDQKSTLTLKKNRGIHFLYDICTLCWRATTLPTYQTLCKTIHVSRLWRTISDCGESWDRA